MTIPENTFVLAYLWKTTPVLGTKALPMYAADEFELPAAPWIRLVGPLWWVFTWFYDIKIINGFIQTWLICSITIMNFSLITAHENGFE